jgi:hypothetical protein
MRCTLGFVALLLLHAGCSDPVMTAQIEALGPEEPGVAPGPDHRPGQPCLHCHSEGGPASSKPFAMAGTVYDTAAPNAKGAADIYVQFTDASGGSPRSTPKTRRSGNFFIPRDDWPDLRFPARVGLYKSLNEAPLVIMKSLINREGSCNFCHRANRDKSVDPRTSVGQIFVEAGEEP